MDSLRYKLEVRIRKKEQEVAEIHRRVELAQHELDVAAEGLRMLRETLNLALRDNGAAPEEFLRAQSSAGKAFKYLRSIGEPRHIGVIVEGIGRKNDTKNRAAVAAQLSTYAREHKVFSRPAPNTFGLLEWEDTPPADGGAQSP